LQNTSDNIYLKDYISHAYDILNAYTHIMTRHILFPYRFRE